MKNLSKHSRFITLLATILLTLSSCEQPTSPETQIAVKPTAIPAGGNYATIQTITLATVTEGADIHYTLDGTDPTVLSQRYSSKINISETTTLKAIAVKTGMVNSGIMSEIYAITVSTIISVTGVSFNDSYITLAKDDSITLIAMVTPENATNKALIWTSSNNDVATVNNGIVAAISTGETTITVTTEDGSYIAECIVTVKPIPVSISITKQPHKTQYTIGEELDITNLEVTVTYSDKSTEIVTITTAHISGFDSTTIGDKTVTITFGGKTVTFIVTVNPTDTSVICRCNGIVEDCECEDCDCEICEKETDGSSSTLTSITLNTTSVKNDYNQHEQLDLSGMVITANYSDSSSATVTNYTSSPANGATLSTTGQITVTVHYTEGTVTVSASFIVTVTAKTLTGITLNTTSVKKEYAKNEQLDLSGMVVTANYSDSTSTTVTGYTTDPTNGATLTTAETITVTVSYTEEAVTRTTTFTVTVSEENKQFRLISYVSTSDNPDYVSQQVHYTKWEWVDPQHWSQAYTSEQETATGKYISSISIFCDGNTTVQNSVVESYDNNNEKYFSSSSTLTTIFYYGTNVAQSTHSISDTTYYATTLNPNYGSIDPSHSETITEYTIVDLGIINGLTCYKRIATDDSYVIYKESSTNYGVPYTVNYYSYSSSGELTSSMEYEETELIPGLFSSRNYTSINAIGSIYYSCSNLQINGSLISYDISYSNNGYTYVTSYVYEVIE